MQKENKLLTVYSLTVNSLRIGTKNFTRLYVAVSIADKNGRKGGISLVDESYLWALQKPYMIPGLLPTGFKNL